MSPRQPHLQFNSQADRPNGLSVSRAAMKPASAPPPLPPHLRSTARRHHHPRPCCLNGTHITSHSGAGRELPLPLLSRPRPPERRAQRGHRHRHHRVPQTDRPPHGRQERAHLDSLRYGNSAAPAAPATAPLPSPPLPTPKRRAHCGHCIFQPHRPPHGRQKANYRKDNPSDAPASPPQIRARQTLFATS